MSESGEAGRTIRLDLAYEGTHYHGFGLQPGQSTIQEVLEEALARSLGERVRVTAAGRTDAGVHASGQVVSFTTRGRLAAPDLLRAANAHLPEDVLVFGAADAPPDLDARRSAIRRHYSYLIWNERLPSLWLGRWSWHLSEALDVAAMQTAADYLLGTHDFASFLGHRSQEPSGRSTVRTVEHADWRQDGPLIELQITANAFMRHMVRGIVGTLVEVGRGRLEPAQLGTILKAADPRRAGPNAPPHGLTLTGVEYPAHLEVTGTLSGQSDRHNRGYPGPAWRPGDRSGSRSSVLSDTIGSGRATDVS